MKVKAFLFVWSIFLFQVVAGQSAFSTKYEHVVDFRQRKIDLPKEAKAVLDTFKKYLKDNPEFKLKISVYCTRGTIEYCYDRVNSIVHVLFDEERIDTNQCIFDWKADVDLNTVRLNILSPVIDINCEPKQWTISFSEKNSVLTFNQRNILSEISSFLSRHPHCQLNITVPYVNNEKTFSRIFRRLSNVKNYLTAGQQVFKNNIVVTNSEENLNLNIISFKITLKTL